MSLLAKIFIVIQAVLVMTYLGMSGALYQQRRDWRTSYQQLKGRYSTAVARAQKEIRALRSYVKAKDDLISSKEREVRSLKTQLDHALQEAQQAKQLFENKRAEFTQLQNNFDGLNRNFADAQKEIAKLRSDLDERTTQRDIAVKRRESAEGQVARLTALTTSLETDLGDLRKTFADTRRSLRDKELLISMAEAAGVNFELLVPGPPVPAIDGTVVAVKTDVDPPLVLLSVGANEKVERGYQFSIYRANQFVGKVVVEKVLNNGAGCRLLFTAEGATVQAGDRAATRLF